LRELFFSDNSNENGCVPQGSALSVTFYLTSAFRSCPTLSIYNMAGEPPPIFRRIELYAKCIARLARLEGDKHSNINNEITNLITENVCILIRIIPRKFNMSPPWDNNYEINTELNALSKQNTAPRFKRHVYRIFDRVTTSPGFSRIIQFYILINRQFSELSSGSNKI